jgi:hypothetical protein
MDMEGSDIVASWGECIQERRLEKTEGMEGSRKRERERERVCVCVNAGLHGQQTSGLPNTSSSISGKKFADTERKREEPRCMTPAE